MPPKKKTDVKPGEEKEGEDPLVFLSNYQKYSKYVIEYYLLSKFIHH